MHEVTPPVARAEAGNGSDAVIRCRQLSKSYRNPWTLKTVHGLRALDLDVARGEIFGLLGPNGAGKTTTLKLLTGLLKPTHGMAWLFGEPVTSVRSRARLGFLSEQPYFDDYLSGLEYLELAGRLSGLGGREASERARHWMGRVGLERPKLVLRKYSKGMLQRLGLAAALVHEPELIILDEPMSGLDPFGRRDVRELILEQRDRGATILFSSHILPDVEMLCDRVAIIFGGALQRTATIKSLIECDHAVEIRCDGVTLVEIPAAWAAHLTRRERPGGTVLALDDGRLLDEVLPWLVRGGVRIRAVAPHRSSLEDLFLDATGQPSVEKGTIPMKEQPSEWRRA